jgi:hypothetical protein
LRKVQDLQRALLEKQLPLNTGYEALAFQPALFDKPPIFNLKTTSHAGRPTNKVANASYRLRVIGCSTYATYQAMLAAPDTLIVVGQTNKVSYPPESDVFEVTGVDGLDWLNHILRK